MLKLDHAKIMFMYIYLSQIKKAKVLNVWFAKATEVAFSYKT